MRQHPSAREVLDQQLQDRWEVLRLAEGEHFPLEVEVGQGLRVEEEHSQPIKNRARGIRSKVRKTTQRHAQPYSRKQRIELELGEVPSAAAGLERELWRALDEPREASLPSKPWHGQLDLHPGR